MSEYYEGLYLSVCVCTCTCVKELAGVLNLHYALYCSICENWEMLHYLEASGEQQVVANSRELFKPFLLQFYLAQNIYLVCNNTGEYNLKWICYADFLKENNSQNFINWNEFSVIVVSNLYLISHGKFSFMILAPWIINH